MVQQVDSESWSKFILLEIERNTKTNDTAWELGFRISIDKAQRMNSWRA